MKDNILHNRCKAWKEREREKWCKAKKTSVSSQHRFFSGVMFYSLSLSLSLAFATAYTELWNNICLFFPQGKVQLTPKSCQMREDAQNRFKVCLHFHWTTKVVLLQTQIFTSSENLNINVVKQALPHVDIPVAYNKHPQEI